MVGKLKYATKLITIDLFDPHGGGRHGAADADGAKKLPISVAALTQHSNRQNFKP
jgi:hypothetical protein